MTKLPRRATALAFVLEAILMAAGVAAAIPPVAALALHGVIVIALAVVTARARGTPDAGTLFMATLVIAVTGPFGALGAWLLPWLARTGRESPKLLDEWYERISNSTATDRLTLRSDHVAIGRAADLGAPPPDRLDTLFASHNIAAQQTALGMIARHFHPDYIPALRLALNSSEPIVRVQAAAVTARVRDKINAHLSDGLAKANAESTHPAEALALIDEVVTCANSGLIGDTDAASRPHRSRSRCQFAPWPASMPSAARANPCGSMTKRATPTNSTCSRPVNSTFSATCAAVNVCRSLAVCAAVRSLRVPVFHANGASPGSARMIAAKPWAATPRRTTDVCIIVEGCYPYVPGGVSGWIDWLIRSQPDTSFSIVSLWPAPDGAEARYAMPPNVLGFHPLYLQSFGDTPRQSARTPRDLDAFAEALQTFITPWRRDGIGGVVGSRRPRRCRGPAVARLQFAGRLGDRAAHVLRSHALWLVPALLLGLARAARRPVRDTRIPAAERQCLSHHLDRLCWPSRRACGARNRPPDHPHRARHLYQRTPHRIARWPTGSPTPSITDTCSTIRASICAICGSAPSRPMPRPVTRPATSSSRSMATIRKCSSHSALCPRRAASSPTASTSPASAACHRAPDDARPTMALIGRVVPIKDVKSYIAAAKMLRETVPDLRA